jgi:hypothetical protein
MERKKMGDNLIKALENVESCFQLIRENRMHKSELDGISKRKAHLKALMAANTGEIHRLASNNVLLCDGLSEEQSKIMDAVMEVVYDGRWADLKLIVLKNRECNCDGKPFGVKNCAGCDNCTCGDS